MWATRLSACPVQLRSSAAASTWSNATLGWNLVGLFVLTWAAARARSVALAGFGLDSLIEIGASIVLVWELAGSDEDHRRPALRLIGTAFVVLALYLGAHSTVVLVTGYHARHSPVGIAWAAVTAGLMFGLAWGKTRTGSALGNHVLSAEGRVTPSMASSPLRSWQDWPPTPPSAGGGQTPRPRTCSCTTRRGRRPRPSRREGQGVRHLRSDGGGAQPTPSSGHAAVPGPSGSTDEHRAEQQRDPAEYRPDRLPGHERAADGADALADPHRADHDEHRSHDEAKSHPSQLPSALPREPPQQVREPLREHRDHGRSVDHQHGSARPSCGSQGPGPCLGPSGRGGPLGGPPPAARACANGPASSNGGGQTGRQADRSAASTRAAKPSRSATEGSPAQATTSSTSGGGCGPAETTTRMGISRPALRAVSA